MASDRAEACSGGHPEPCCPGTRPGRSREAATGMGGQPQSQAGGSWLPPTQVTVEKKLPLSQGEALPWGAAPCRADSSVTSDPTLPTWPLAPRSPEG